MQLYRTLVLFATLSAACGLRCFTCKTDEPKPCTTSTLCPNNFDRCFTGKMQGSNVVVSDCYHSNHCGGTTRCCEGDLCNSAFPTGPSVLLLLVASSILKFIL